MKITPLAKSPIHPLPAASIAARKHRTRKTDAKLVAALVASGLLATSWSAFGQAVPLGAAQNLTILGGSTVTNTGPTIITGNLGLSPGSAVTGFPPGTVTAGTIHINDALANQAHADTSNAFLQLSGEIRTANLTGVNLGGLTLTPGIYHFDTSAQLTGTLHLDTGGDPNAAFHFQIGTTLTTASGSMIDILLGATSDNVFWEVGSSATIGSGSLFYGNLLADQSITFDTGASLANGRALEIGRAHV